MYATTKDQPIFKGKNKTDINLPWVLRAVNFFKQHFTCTESQEMSAAYDDLPAYQKIKAWRRPLSNGKLHSLTLLILPPTVPIWPL